MRTSNPSANTRADKLRQRRTDQTKQRVERVGSYARNPVHASPPVVSRSRSVGRPVMQRAAKARPRRIFFLNLGTNVEVATPALPVIRPGWRILSSLLVLALSGLLLFVLSTSTFKVQSAQLTGFKRVSLSDVEAVIKLQNRLIFTIEPEVLKTTLAKSFPELIDIKVQVGLPAQVSIQAAERTPVLAWRQKDSTVWVDAQGYTFHPRGSEAPALLVESSEVPPLYPVPVVKPTQAPGSTPTPKPTAVPPSIIAPGMRLDLKLVASALTLSKYMPAKTNLAYSPTDGLGWKDARGWTVYFGMTLDDLELKISMYQAIVDQLTKQGTKPSLISIKDIDAPYYRTER